MISKRIDSVVLYCAFNGPYLEYAKELISSFLYHHPSHYVIATSVNCSSKDLKIFKNKNIMLDVKTKVWNKKGNEEEYFKCFMSQYRFCYLSQLMDSNHNIKQIISLDADSIVLRSLQPYFNLLKKHHDIIFNLNRHRRKCNRIIANIILFRNNKNTRKFFKIYRTRYAKIGKMDWFTDQLILYDIWQENKSNVAWSSFRRYKKRLHMDDYIRHISRRLHV